MNGSARHGAGRGGQADPSGHLIGYSLIALWGHTQQEFARKSATNPVIELSSAYVGCFQRAGRLSIIRKTRDSPVGELEVHDIGEGMICDRMIPLAVTDELNQPGLLMGGMSVEDARARFFRVDHLACHAEEQLLARHVRALSAVHSGCFLQTFVCAAAGIPVASRIAAASSNFIAVSFPEVPKADGHPNGHGRAGGCAKANKPKVIL